MIKIYKKHLFNIFSISILEVCGIFLSLVFILGFLEEINFFKNSDIAISHIFFLTLLNVPSLFFEIFPFIFLISTQLFFIKLFDGDEVTTFNKFGINNFKILQIIASASFLFGLIIVLVFYNFSAKLKFTYLELKNGYTSDNKYLAVVTSNGLWIKDEINNVVSFINSETMNGDYLTNVSITQFDRNFNLLQTIESENVNIKEKEWIMFDTKVSKTEEDTKNYKKFNFVSNFNTEKINGLFSNLSSLTIWELYKTKKDYKNLGYSTSKIDIHNKRIYSFPIYLTLMTVLSCIIMLNVKKNYPTLPNIVLGILISVFVYYINYFLSLLGEKEKIPLDFSIWSPLLILFLICSIGLVHLDEK